jgi:hypothetical protein
MAKWSNVAVCHKIERWCRCLSVVYNSVHKVIHRLYNIVIQEIHCFQQHSSEYLGVGGLCNWCLES